MSMTADRAAVPAPPTHLAAAAIATLGWAAGFALTEIDAQINLPDPIVNGAWSVAIAGTVVAVLLTARQALRGQIRLEAERTRADLAALEQIAKQTRVDVVAPHADLVRQNKQLRIDLQGLAAMVYQMDAATQQNAAAATLLAGQVEQVSAKLADRNRIDALIMEAWQHRAEQQPNLHDGIDPVVIEAARRIVRRLDSEN